MRVRICHLSSVPAAAGSFCLHPAFVWLLVIGYWLLVIGYWLLAIGYWLLAIGYWLLAIGYWLVSRYAGEA